MSWTRMQSRKRGLLPSIFVAFGLFSPVAQADLMGWLVGKPKPTTTPIVQQTLPVDVCGEALAVPDSAVLDRIQKSGLAARMSPESIESLTKLSDKQNAELILSRLYEGIDDDGVRADIQLLKREFKALETFHVGVFLLGTGRRIMTYHVTVKTLAERDLLLEILARNPVLSVGSVIVRKN